MLLIPILVCSEYRKNERSFMFKVDNVVTRLDPNFGKSSVTNMVSDGSVNWDI